MEVHGDHPFLHDGSSHLGTSTSSNPNIVTNLLTSLSTLIGGGATSGMLTHGAAANISTQLSGVPGFISAVQPNNNTSGLPQAYITVLFFDERFNFISAADGGVYQTQVRSADAGNANPAPLLTGNAIAPKNGYVYAYVSNRSDQDVYFDNFKVTIQAASIIEENHYYSFGLKIAAISSKKLGDAGEGKLKNSYQFNGKEMLDEDADLNWYDYGFRSYDPQIGRFMQLDPLTWDYEELTPYQFAGNDPIANVDLDGLEPSNVTNFLRTLGTGVEEVAIHALTKGANAGGWAVSWLENGFTHTMLFKAAPILGKARTFISVAVSASRVLNNYNYTAAAKDAFWKGVTWINENINPLTPIAELITGKAFNGGRFDVDKSRMTSFTEASISLIPGGKIEGAAFKQIEKVALKEGAEASEKMAMKSAEKNIAGKLASGRTGKSIIHHIASNKHLTKYTAQFESIANKYGLKLDASWNKVEISDVYHYSSHPDQYHEFVLRGMRAADAGAVGNQAKFLQLFDLYVKQPLLQNPSILNKTGW